MLFTAACLYEDVWYATTTRLLACARITVHGPKSRAVALGAWSAELRKGPDRGAGSSCGLALGLCSLLN